LREFAFRHNKQIKVFNKDIDLIALESS